MPLRFDLAQISKPTIDQNGYLHADAYVTRAGVFVYHHPNGETTRELRHPDDVLKADSLNTLHNRPVTDGHPYPGRLDAKNTRQFAVGNVVGDVEADGNLVRTKIMVTDQAAIDKIMDDENPVREVSCGYVCDTEKAEGTFDGEHYDHQQTNIVYNHVALVDKGRAGPNVRLVLDAADGAVEGVDIELKQDHKQKKEQNTMKVIQIKKDGMKTATFKVDAIDVEVGEDFQPAVQVVLDMLDSAVAHVKTLEEKCDGLNGQVDELKAKAEIPPEKLAAMVAERADVLGVACHLGVETKLDSLSVDDIKKEIVAKANPDTSLADASTGYVNGRYDSIVDRIKADNEGLASLAALKKATTPDDTKNLKKDNKKDDDDLTPRQKFIVDSQEMWKGDQAQA